MKNLGSTTRMVLKLLEERPKSVWTLMEETGCIYRSVYVTLYNLRKRGEVKKEGAFFCLVR